MCYNAPVGRRLSIGSGLAAGSASGTRRDEGWLAGIWARQAFDRHELHTTSGLDFQVVYPGLQVGGAGPDFRGAILALPDGRLLRGDVEIHLHSQGWEQHGHSHDVTYDGVLLHVVLIAGGRTRNSRGELVLTLELGDRLQHGRPAEPKPLAEAPGQLTYVVAPCRRRLPSLEATEVRGQLQGLALERFHAKQGVFEGELAVFEPDHVLYAGLLEALGYSRNREPFRALAQLVPLDCVRLARTPAAIEALLLDAAGLAELPAACVDGSACLPPGAPAADAGLCGLRLEARLWQTVGVRPDNRPARRIAQGAALLARLAGALRDELLAPLAELCDVHGEAIRRLRSGWHEQLRELGPQRADAVAVNVLLPFAAAYGQATCQFGLAERATAAFLAYPAGGDNQVTRHLRGEVLGPLADAAR